jgi:hypothetical protein
MRQLGILIVVLMAFLMSTNVALAGNKVLAVVFDQEKVHLDSILPAIGFEPVYSDTFFPDMGEYCLVLVDRYSACNPQSAVYIENYVQSGGGVIVQSGTPLYLAGSTDLSPIKHWFGAGRYLNDNDSLTLLVDHPFESDLVSGTLLTHGTDPCNYGPAVSDIQPGANVLARWHGRCGNNVAIFYYHYGNGRVFYSNGFYGTLNPDPLLVLTKAAMLWASVCPRAVEICNAFLTPDKLNVMRDAVHSFKVHVYPCEPMDVSVGDTAEVYVDLDDNGNFDEYENYLAIVSSTDSDGNATDIAVKVYDVPLTEEIDPYVAIYSINNIPIVDTLGNPIDYLQLITFSPHKSATQSALPDQVTLQQNHPNPFNPETIIKYSLTQATHVKLSIYNIVGQKVRTLVDEYQKAGAKEVFWDARDENGNEVGSGIYFYKIKTSEYSEAKKMILLR